MMFSVSSILVQRIAITEVSVVRGRQFRVDSINDFTARLIPAALIT